MPIDELMADERSDLCPMCQGQGSCTLGPPNGEYYIRIRLRINGGQPTLYLGGAEYVIPSDTEDPRLSDGYRAADRLVNIYASKGYELHTFTSEASQLMWVMQWRWR